MLFFFRSLGEDVVTTTFKSCSYPSSRPRRRTALCHCQPSGPPHTALDKARPAEREAEDMILQPGFGVSCVYDIAWSVSALFKLVCATNIEYDIPRLVRLFRDTLRTCKSIHVDCDGLGSFALASQPNNKVHLSRQLSSLQLEEDT